MKREDSGMAAKKKGARHMREWSAGDMKKLRQFAKQKVSARVAAQKLGRSPGAVQGHDGRRVLPLDQPQEVISGSAARGAPRPAIPAGPCDSELVQIWPGPAAP